MIARDRPTWGTRLTGLLTAILVLTTPFLPSCENVFGVYNNPVDPVVLGLPSAPADLAASAADGLVNLTWTAVSRADSYKVFYRVGSTVTTTDNQVAPSAINGTTAGITGLANGSQYAFIVVAVNRAGSSLPSNIVRATPTAPIQVPTAPTNLVATPGNGQVSLAWTAVSGATGYKVFYGLGTSASPGDTQLPANALSGTTATVGGLLNGASYAFIVVAYNSAGDGPASLVATATPAAPVVAPVTPLNFTATAGNAQVSLSWTAVTNADSYKVYFAVGTAVTTSSALVPSTMINGTSATVTGLANGSQYAFLIVAVNSAGTSLPSAIATATPMAPVVVPTAPVNLTATAGDAQVTLTWTALSNADSYKVFYRAGNQATTADAAIATNSATATVTGLVNATQYAFVVTAVNSAGMSPASLVVTATPAPPVTIPTAPAGVSAESGDGLIILNWATVSGATRYAVYYAVGPNVTTNDLPVPDAMITATKANITGLTNDTAYSFIVLAINSAGTSPPSAIVHCSPAPPIPATPTGLAAQALDAKVILTWTASANAASYNLYWSLTSGFTLANGTRISNITPTTYPHSGLTNGLTYYYRVTAVNSKGESAPSSELAAQPYSAAAVYVAPTGNDLRDGSSPTYAKATIQAGINAATALGRHEVWVAAGTYNSGQIILASGVSLIGAWKTDFSGRDLVNLHSLIVNTDATDTANVSATNLTQPAVIDGFSFKRAMLTGAAWNYGAVFLNTSFNLTVRNNIIYAGSTEAGPMVGITTTAGSNSIYNNLIYGGTSTTGRVICIWGNGGATDLIANNTLVTGNGPPSSYLHAIMVRADGGVTHLRLVNNLLVGFNSTTYTSLYHMNSGSTNYPQAYTTNLFYISPTTGIDGEYVYYGSGNGNNINVTNYSSKAVMIEGGVAATLTSPDPTWKNLVNVDPWFVNQAGLDFHLKPGSPALNSGTNLGSLFTTDLEGNPRGTNWSLGAFQ